MKPFLVCIHDATPAYTREIRTMLRELAPLLGPHFSVAAVPNWHGVWPLTAYPNFCHLLLESCDEILLHGYFHQRQCGRGVTSWLTQGSDEMNSLSAAETYQTLERGQHLFTEAFGKPAHGFLAPAWQQGRVYDSDGAALGLKYVLGFFALQTWTGQKLPLATWTWDCGRWPWLGHIGHGVGWLGYTLKRGIPTLAIHPQDLERGFWRKILQLTQHLLANGYTPSTLTNLLEAPC
jgi:hypothetical protein